jgi:hypothetical protein
LLLADLVAEEEVAVVAVLAEVEVEVVVAAAWQHVQLRDQACQA